MGLDASAVEVARFGCRQEAPLRRHRDAARGGVLLWLPSLPNAEGFRERFGIEPAFAITMTTRGQLRLGRRVGIAVFAANPMRVGFEA